VDEGLSHFVQLASPAASAHSLVQQNKTDSIVVD